MSANSVDTLEQDVARRAFPAVMVQGKVLTVTQMDASTVAATTTLRLCPGRKVALRLNDAMTRAATIDSAMVHSLKGGVTYAVRLISDAPFWGSAGLSEAAN